MMAAGSGCAIAGIAMHIGNAASAIVRMVRRVI